MAYLKKTWRLGDRVEVEERHSARYGAPGQERAEKSTPTSEDVRRNNQRRKECTCRRRLKMYFRDGEDLFITLTYREDARPADVAEAKAHWRKLTNFLRPHYREAGVELRWIRNIERGTRGAWHIHAVLKDIPGEKVDRLVEEFWTGTAGLGHVNFRRTELKGNGAARLAAYLTKSEVVITKTKSGEWEKPRLAESSYSSSRNMPLPEPERKVIRYRTLNRKPRIPEGWEMDPDSLETWVNPVTGFLHRSYAYSRKKGEECQSTGGRGRMRSSSVRDSQKGDSPGKSSPGSGSGSGRDRRYPSS